MAVSVKIWGAVVLVAALAVTAAAAGAPVRSSNLARVTGDEPEYLLTAISIAEDFSLDVSDEIENGRYREFHEVRLRPQARVLEGDRMVSPHDPLLPALLAPAIWLATITGISGFLLAKLTISLMAGVLAALLVWIAVERFGIRLFPAVLTVGVFATSAPLAVYGSQLYPEIPAALVLSVGVAGLSGPLRTGGLAAVIGGVVSLSWLGTKFLPVAAVLAVVALVRLWRLDRRRHVVLVAALFGVGGALYVYGHLFWYGALTVYATGEHFSQTGQFSVMGVSPDFLSRSSRLIGLLIDGRFGLAAWQPAWLLLIPASAALLAARTPGWTVLFVPLLAGWLTATFLALTMHGFWSPGRQVVVVLPLAVLVVAWWTNRSRAALAALVVLGATGVFSLAWLFWEGHTAGMTLAVHFQQTSSPVYRAAATVLPHYMQDTSGTWILHGVWVSGAVIIATLAAKSARRPVSSTPA